jgi:predicted metal-dependent hydrolase
MDIRIVRSTKRAKTVSARLVDDVLEILAPAHLSDAELAPMIDNLKQRLTKRTEQRQLDDGELDQIAKRLNKAYFKSRLTWTSLIWSTQQDKRYGSCTPALKTIRISHLLAKMPLFVKEYVVMHELAHLLEANHGPRFWELVNRYPRTERARGYLMAVGLEGLEEAPEDVE